MGVSLNSTSGRRPAAQFLVKTPLSSAEVGRLYAAETQAEAEESTEIRFIPKETLLEEEEEREEEEGKEVDGGDKLTNLWDELAPNAQGCILIARRYVL